MDLSTDKHYAFFVRFLMLRQSVKRAQLYDSFLSVFQFKLLCIPILLDYLIGSSPLTFPLSVLIYLRSGWSEEVKPMSSGNKIRFNPFSRRKRKGDAWHFPLDFSHRKNLSHFRVVFFWDNQRKRHLLKRHIKNAELSIETPHHK